MLSPLAALKLDDAGVGLVRHLRTPQTHGNAAAFGWVDPRQNWSDDRLQQKRQLIPPRGELRSRWLAHSCQTPTSQWAIARQKTMVLDASPAIKDFGWNPRDFVRNSKGLIQQSVRTPRFSSTFPALPRLATVKSFE